MQQPDIIQGYTDAAGDLVPRYDALTFAQVLAPVADLLPTSPGEVLDVGSGTGRCAAGFAERGHRVVAAEPVLPFLEAARLLHPSPRISWVEDRLPRLDRVGATQRRFDLVTLIAVWQHIAPEERAPALATLAALTAEEGRLILSLRHGPGAPQRPCFACDPDETIAGAGAVGLRVSARRSAPSIQQQNRDAGVTWTWLAFDKGQSRIH